MAFARASNGTNCAASAILWRIVPEHCTCSSCVLTLLRLLRSVGRQYEFSNWKQGELLRSRFVSQDKCLQGDPTRLTFGHPTSRTRNGEHSTQLVVGTGTSMRGVFGGSDIATLGTADILDQQR